MSRKMLKGGSKNDIDKAVDFFTKTKEFTQESKETAKRKFDALRNPSNKAFVDNVKNVINIAFETAGIYDLNTEFTNDSQAEQFVENKLNPPPPVPIKSELERGGEDALNVNMDATKQSRLSDVILGEIGFTKTAEGSFTPTEGDRPPNRGENQKKFIISKSSEINEALKQEGIKEQVKGQNQGAITDYNKAMGAAKDYLDGFEFTEITGGKRSRRRRSKTRSRRTKNKRKKQYKR
jgi:hypothetical protein